MASQAEPDVLTLRPLVAQVVLVAAGAPASEQTRPDFGCSAAARGTSRGETRAWYLLLIVPLIGVLLPTFYNLLQPELAGIPFFYWYQMLWVPLSVATTVLVYVKTRARGGDDA